MSFPRQRANGSLMFKFVSLLLLVFVSIQKDQLQEASAAQETEKTKEAWAGTLDVGVAQLRLEMDIEKADDGSWSGTMVSVDQANAELALEDVVRDANKFSFAIKAARVEFSGEENADGKIVGTFTQFGKEFPLELSPLGDRVALEHIQTWTGIMKAGPQEYDFQFRVFQDSAGVMSAKLDSFSERVFGLACTITHGDGHEVEITVPATAAKIVGEFSEDHNSLTGKWIQNGNELDLNLKRIALGMTREPKPAERPQTPKAPFPYSTREVKIENSAESVTLAGTLTIPEGVSESNKSPVVIFITGSGPQDRDETIHGHKPFAVIADAFARHGIASIRFDDRGVGDSTGDFTTATSVDFAKDVASVVEFSKTQPELDGAKVVLAGHSEGGIIAPMVASQREDIAGLILMAGTGVDGKQILINQSQAVIKVNGGTEAEVELNTRVLNKSIALLGTETVEQADFPDRVKDLLKTELTAEQLAEFEKDATTEILIAQLNTPWFRFFTKHDPAPALEKCKCPVLILIGDKDLQVDPELNLPPMKAALERGGNQNVTIKVMANLNHLFQTSMTGNPNEYAKLSETIAPAAIKQMTDWALAKFVN